MRMSVFFSAVFSCLTAVVGIIVGCRSFVSACTSFGVRFSRALQLRVRRRRADN